MHRNTLLLVGLLAIVAALVVGVNFGRRYASQPTTGQPLSSPILTPTGIALSTYMNPYCGISFEYPGNFTALEAASGSAILLNPENANASIAVACQEEIPRPALTADKIEEATISGVTVELYHDVSSEDGSPLDKLIFTHPTRKHDVYIAGSGTVFEQITSTLDIITGN